ncbi:DUF6473 family protein [Fuscibacter oryzae]|uniref:DUF6473 domain-containing protein n=1 Tax=Fuscibacter oryzae TaxID=2803939 RepID=A0A8J7MPG6_9RHOB|nr:DUF6473 family protein [Fuscibacter oryzae]MBL4927097.1 hypothetical protein [Fuscibacter oryzae]
MAFVFQGAGALDYAPCHYAGSRLAFRGPERPVTGCYLACLGGTETYGRFVPRPFPDLLEAELGLPVLNLGCANAGPDVFLAEPALLALMAGAEAVVVQAAGLPNLSNAFYSVHPRRNDRFLGATPRLRTLFPEMDFTDFAFTQHLLHSLASRSPHRFAEVLAELRRAWLRQMRTLLAHLQGRAILLSLGAQSPGDPFALDEGLLAALQPFCAAILHSAPPFGDQGLEGMFCTALEVPAARMLPGPQHHRQVARALVPLIRDRM